MWSSKYRRAQGWAFRKRQSLCHFFYIFGDLFTVGKGNRPGGYTEKWGLQRRKPRSQSVLECGNLSRDSLPHADTPKVLTYPDTYGSWCCRAKGWQTLLCWEEALGARHWCPRLGLVSPRKVWQPWHTQSVRGWGWEFSFVTQIPSPELNLAAECLQPRCLSAAVLVLLESCRAGFYCRLWFCSLLYWCLVLEYHSQSHKLSTTLN